MYVSCGAENAAISFGVCSDFIPPCSGCVSPWESGCSAFMYEILRIST